MVLKSVDDVDGNGFDDELSSTMIAYLAKNNNIRARGKNNSEPRNFKRNEPTKMNNTNKSKEKVSQTSNNSLSQQCFGCQWYGYVKSEYPTFLRSKGKAMALTLSDDEVSDHESSSDEDGNFITFIATTIVDESLVVDKNPSDGELSKSVDLQEAYNKLCKVIAKNAMNVDLSLKKIAFLKLDKKILLLKLFDANELIDKVKTKNMLLLDKVKNLELELSFAREQTNRSASSKFDHMLSIQKSPLDKTGLGFKYSISVSKIHSTNFVTSSEPPKSEIVKPVEVTPPPMKIRVDFKNSKPKNPILPKDKVHDRLLWVCHFCGKTKYIRLNYFKLQATKQAIKPKVPMPPAQDPIVLISKLVKALNPYTNPRVAHHSNMNNNSNARVASKKFWMQKT